MAYLVALSVAAGALTYDSSPVRNPAMLIMFLVTLVGVAAVTEASRRAMWEDRAAAIRDALTGLMNRAALERRAAELHDRVADTRPTPSGSSSPTSTTSSRSTTCTVTSAGTSVA